MPIYLLDESLKVAIFYEANDCEFEDNICIQISEDCPEDEKVFIADESNLYLSIEQARQLLEALQTAIKDSEEACQGKTWG